MGALPNNSLFHVLDAVDDLISDNDDLADEVERQQQEIDDLNEQLEQKDAEMANMQREMQAEIDDLRRQLLEAQNEHLESEKQQLDERDEEERNEERFHFVHPELDETEAWRIHDSVKRLVAHHRVKEICQYLQESRKNRKVLLPETPGVAYAELVRMGMPNGEGFSEKYFSSCYLR